MGLLEVKWNEQEQATYYIDVDKYSIAHEYQTYIRLDSFSGTYYFYKRSGEVILNDGVKERLINCKSWKIIRKDNNND